MNRYELESLIRDLDSALTTLGGGNGALAAREIRLKSLIAVAHSEAMELMRERAASPPSVPAGQPPELV